MDLKPVVDRFYERLLEEPTLVQTFEGKDLSRIKRHQVLLLQGVLGLTDQENVWDLKAAHADLGITMDQFELVGWHLSQTLREFNVSDEVHDKVMLTVVSMVDNIVTK